jgi:hypothetical protein
MSKIVPLISSASVGPLGLFHLPRLWQKSLLGALGLLADGYKDVGPGYDHKVLTTIGLDPDAVRAYIHANKPSYAVFEKWVTAQPGVKLDAETIAATNATVAGYHHQDTVRQGILAASGIPDEGKILDAVTLNNLDDWHTFHASVTE